MRKTYLPSLFFENALDDLFSPDVVKRESSGISLYEDEKNIYVEAYMPGIKPEDIDLDFATFNGLDQAA